MTLTNTLLISSIVCLIVIGMTPCHDWSYLQLILALWPLIAFTILFGAKQTQKTQNCTTMGLSLGIVLADLALLMMYATRSCFL